MKRTTSCLASISCAMFGLSLLNGCNGGVFGTVGPDYVPPSSATAPRWHAPLQDSAAAHQGSAQQLAEWWAQFNDAALDALIAAAQLHSSTLAQAAATIERARADAIAAGAAASPSLDGIASFNRSAFTMGGPLALRMQSQLGVQSRWEIDLFGGLARERESRQAALQSKVALWHEARVSLAAEVANAYVNLRYCEIQVDQAQAELQSRSATARITTTAERAGMQPTSTVALARAAEAEASTTVTQRRAQCEISIKGLVALTAIEEPALREILAKTVKGVADDVKPTAGSTPPDSNLSMAASRLPQPSMFRIDALPAHVIAQRPDIAAAERQLAAANADIGSVDATRFPRLTLSGNILPTRTAIGSAPALSLTTWSIGPSLELPLLDGGRRSANVDAARAQYLAAESAYRSKVRNAVREVEEALVRLQSASDRAKEFDAAARSYRANLAAAQSMLRAGLGSALELETARRPSLAADAALAAIEQERVAAWISLYRAVGGGWDANAPIASR